MSRFLLFLLFVAPCTLSAQHHIHEGHSHSHSDFEIGLSVGIANLVDENENAPSAHLHFLRKVGSEGLLNRISIGAGFEYIFSEHTHYSIVGTISLNPYSAFKLDISPGILVTEHEEEKEKQFVTHIELTYEFDYLGFGIGPVIGYGFAKEDNHFMAGIHIGIGL